MTEPNFIFADPEWIVTGYGKLRSWTSLAQAHLERDGAAIVGAVSFDPDSPDVLWEPENLDCAPAKPAPEAGPPSGTPVLIQSFPHPTVHRARVEQVVSLIRGGAADKVVLGRSETLRLDPPLSPFAAFNSFRRTDLAGHGYLVDLGSGHLVGSSPELLVSLYGREVSAFPLAGTRARAAGDEDRCRGEELLSSTKDRAEHAYVTNALATALGPLCEELEVPEEPQLVPTPTTWHLGTPIHGRLAPGTHSILDLVDLIHPTPAVCGSPEVRALDIIRAVEGRGSRGFFGGAVGYCDAAGNGSFRVTIRGAVLDRDGRFATSWAGGGLTAQSDPDHELAETVVKLSRARQGLGQLDAAGPTCDAVRPTRDAAGSTCDAVRPTLKGAAE